MTAGFAKHLGIIRATKWRDMRGESVPTPKKRRYPQHDYFVNVWVPVVARNRHEAWHVAMTRLVRQVPSRTQLRDRVHRRRP